MGADEGDANLANIPDHSNDNNINITSTPYMSGNTSNTSILVPTILAYANKVSLHPTSGTDLIAVLDSTTTKDMSG